MLAHTVAPKSQPNEIKSTLYWKQENLGVGTVSVFRSGHNSRKCFPMLLLGSWYTFQLLHSSLRRWRREGPRSCLTFPRSCCFSPKPGTHTLYTFPLPPSSHIIQPQGGYWYPSLDGVWNPKPWATWGTCPLPISSVSQSITVWPTSPSSHVWSVIRQKFPLAIKRFWGEKS